LTGIVYNILRSPKELRPHPLNKEIYGDESADSDLVESIRNKGILEPLVIRDDNVILSGHRRWVAAKALSLDKVPCRVLSFSDPLDEEETLIEFNRQREKTFTQRMKESDHLLVIEREKADRRMKLGKYECPICHETFSEKVWHCPVCAHHWPMHREECWNCHKYSRGGVVGDSIEINPPDMCKEGYENETNTIVSQKVGIGPRQFREARTIWEKAKDGDEQAGKLVREIDTGKTAIHTAFKEIKKVDDLQARREEIAAKADAAAKLPDTVTVHHGDFLKDYVKIEKGSVDCIITDPPYIKEWLGNYEAFAVAAEYVLKPGGFLVTYIGHIHMDKILAQMTPYLDFYWIACLKHAGTAKAVHSRSVQCGMKPILIFQKEPRIKPKRYFCDIIQGTGREKGAHEWQQGEEELRQIFEPFTDPGDIILDPFMGSGTVIAMGQKLGRKVIGFDIDPLNVEIVKGRVVSNDRVL
jgi:ParB-like chromosome segregation protein Spo0J